MTRSDFIHLRVHSAYSLSQGAIKIAELTELCKKNAIPALSITDSGNLFGALEFSIACAKAGIQPIVGCIIQTQERSKTQNFERGKNRGELLLLAKNEIGYKNLLKLVSKSFMENTDEDGAFLYLDDFEDFSEGLIALTGGVSGLIGGHLAKGNLPEAERILDKLKVLFPDHLYIELTRHGTDVEKVTEKPFIDLAYKHDLPLVATNGVFFADRGMFQAHDALVCIAHSTYLTETNRIHYTEENYFKSPKEMQKLFADIPEAIANTVTIAKRCSFMPEPHAPMLPSFQTEGGRSEEDELRAVAAEGLEERLRQNSIKNENPYFERLDYELNVINRMGFPGYFLIVSDFMRWSKKEGIPVGPGRGSGAGSVVAWSLQITDLDPLRFGLLFERFLNPERVSMPDFDIDFCQERRDEVIQYVCNKYGSDKVSQIITFGKLQARAVLRDVGRVMQMPYGQVDKICKMIPFNPLAPVTLSQAIDLDSELRREAKNDPQVKKLLDTGLRLEGLFRHTSTHAAGVVIASRPLVEVVPLYTDGRSEIPIAGYSMKYAEMAGLVKFDFLGLKTLTTISQTCKLIEEQGGKIDITAIPFDDKATFKMLSEGSSVGVFQMESSGMRDSLRKMKPDNIEDIIALISLYRPGPMENIPTYIARKHGLEKPDYLHPLLEDCLKETFGVIIYQEQVMQIAQILAGYSLGTADLLRRAMGKKIKSEMDAQRDMFVDGAVKNGVDKKQASSIFDLVAKFAGYGFNKSHAAAYAVIGYQTAYLKANYPVEFLTASMNIDIGNTDKLSIFREEAISSGITILPPNINQSYAHFTVEKLVDSSSPESCKNSRAISCNNPEIPLELPRANSGNDEGARRKHGIRYGLGALKNVGIAALEEMEKEREQNGAYKDIFDFAKRLDNRVINKRQVESLAKVGALDELSLNRRQLFEAATTITRYSQVAAEERASNQSNLFGDIEDNDIPPIRLPDVEDWGKTERLSQEFDAIGFYLTAHPLDDYKEDLKRGKVIPANEVEKKVTESGVKVKLAGVVTRVTHRATGKKRFAYIYISDPTASIEISAFNEELISDSRELLEGSVPLLITAEARKDDGGVRLQAESIVSLESFFKERHSSVKIFCEKEVDVKTLIPEVKNLLKETENGNANLHFILPTPDKMQAEIVLREKYFLQQFTLNLLTNMNGITKVVAD